MRFLHTSDWHLGRIFHQSHLTGDQAHVLESFLALAADVRPDAILIAGDVYDRTQPPAEAVTLLDATLQRLVGDLGIRVVLISGNHDSAERLGFGARLLAARGLHIVSRFPDALAPIVFTDAHGTVHVHALPYAEPVEARGFLGRDDLADHDASMRGQVEAIRAEVPAGTRSILVAHAFVAGGDASDSERPLSVGGSGAVDVGAFAGFQYVALGHLHRPQAPDAERVVYSGSLMKYSFSEAEHVKGATLVEMDGAGRCRTERIPLAPKRDVRVVTGRFEDILHGPGAGESRDDFVLVRLTDDHSPLDAMGRLREIYPNVLYMERIPPELPDGEPVFSGDHRKRSHLEHFRVFFEQVTGEPMSAEEEAVYVETTEAMLRGGESEA